MKKIQRKKKEKSTEMYIKYACLHVSRTYISKAKALDNLHNLLDFYHFQNEAKKKTSKNKVARPEKWASRFLFKHENSLAGVFFSSRKKIKKRRKRKNV